MANLLADPNNWEDIDYNGPPAPQWNGGFYEFIVVYTGSLQTAMLRLAAGVPATLADNVSGTVALSGMSGNFGDYYLSVYNIFGGQVLSIGPLPTDGSTYEFYFEWFENFGGIAVTNGETQLGYYEGTIAITPNLEYSVEPVSISGSVEDFTVTDVPWEPVDGLAPVEGFAGYQADPMDTSWQPYQDAGQWFMHYAGDDLTPGVYTIRYRGFVDSEIVTDWADITITVTGAADTDDLNCDCDGDWDHQTLQQVYERVMRRMGYGNQIDRPPPGVQQLVFDYIREAQDLVMADFDEIGHKRYFSWDMEIGQRFFDFNANRDVCAKLMSAMTIMAVYCRRGDEVWRLNRGIDPLWFSGGIHNSDPTNYDVRQCIEVFPPPAEPMTLVILAKFKALPLEDPQDITVADPEAIFLRTIALYKSDKQHANAQTYSGQYLTYIGNINADEHRDFRWIPFESIQGVDDRGRKERLTRRMDPLVYGEEP